MMETDLDLAAPPLEGPFAPAPTYHVDARAIRFSRYELVLEHAGQIVAVLGKCCEKILKLVWEAARRADVHRKNAFGNIRGSSADDLMTICHRGRCHIFTRNFTSRHVPPATSQIRNKLVFSAIRTHRTWPFARTSRRDKRIDGIRSPASPEERRDLDQRRRSPRAPPGSSPCTAQRTDDWRDFLFNLQGRLLHARDSSFGASRGGNLSVLHVAR